VAAIPYISAKCREIYTKQFDQLPNPKTFTISDNGHCGWSVDYDDAPTSALKGCQLVTPDSTCRVYRVNDNVVWEKAK
jgi:hypothetical protein